MDCLKSRPVHLCTFAQLGAGHRLEVNKFEAENVGAAALLGDL